MLYEMRANEIVRIVFFLHAIFRFHVRAENLYFLETEYVGWHVHAEILF